MEIYISRDGTKYGPYQKSDVEQMLTAGKLTESDLAWCESLSEWVPLGSLIVPNQKVSKPLKTPKPKTNWRDSIGSCVTFLGYTLIIFGLWRSCKAEDSWSPREAGSYENYKSIESRMTLLMIVGFILIAPSLWESLTRKAGNLNREIKKAEEFQRKARLDPDHCPNCGFDQFDTYYPSKPQLWTPLNPTGIILGAAANSMADAIFKPERICKKCGCRWPHT